MNPDDPDLADLVLSGPTAGADPALCREADSIAAALARAAGEVVPPGDLLGHLLDRVGGRQPIVRTAADGPWKPWLLPGVTRRILFVDRQHRRLTMLLRVTAGSRVPAHPHPGVEEVYLVEGDLRAEDGSVLRAGDYQRWEGGTTHGEQWSVGGCTALVIASLGEQSAP